MSRVLTEKTIMLNSSTLINSNRYNSLEVHKCGKLKRQKTARIFVKFDI
jgi:hypothetical protein